MIPPISVLAELNMEFLFLTRMSRDLPDASDRLTAQSNLRHEISVKRSRPRCSE